MSSLATDLDLCGIFFLIHSMTASDDDDNDDDDDDNDICDKELLMVKTLCKS